MFSVNGHFKGTSRVWKKESKGKGDGKLSRYYCYICGATSLVIDKEISNLPRCKYDDAIQIPVCLLFINTIRARVVLLSITWYRERRR
ncbi:hypothetical protein BdWA1_000815 [Babesia duncani]|uniref:STEEP1 domain-containing protein n=1 Tax=Babesia duncani TaxID=323732 RepID=A0AAD9PN04_9APIC|nr:hypothetical protein BdWA1_000815 [Babesia duncani]